MKNTEQDTLPSSSSIPRSDSSDTERSGSNSASERIASPTIAKRRGTGPRTKLGKERSSQNSLKHGIFSERVSPGEEKEAARLHRILRKELHLRGFEDEFFGTDMVLTALMKKRLEKYTRDELRKADAQADRDRSTRYDMRWSLRRNASSSQNRLHPNFCVIFLEKMKANIERRGLNPEQDLPILYPIFSRGESLTAFGFTIIFPYKVLQAETNAGRKPADPNDERKTLVLEAIDYAIEDEKLSARLEAIYDREDLQDRTSHLPDAVADRILRSQTANQSRFIRSLHGLESYRRLRATAGK